MSSDVVGGVTWELEILYHEKFEQYFRIRADILFDNGILIKDIGKQRDVFRERSEW